MSQRSKIVGELLLAMSICSKF